MPLLQWNPRPINPKPVPMTLMLLTSRTFGGFAAGARLQHLVCVHGHMTVLSGRSRPKPS